MKYRLLYLLTGIFMLVSLVQCKNSVTGGSEENSEIDLEKFSLIAPKKNSKQSTSLNFEWENVEVANAFHIQMSTDKKFAKILVDSTVDSTKFSIQGLPHKTKIYWQVRPVVKGQRTFWSDTWDISTVAKPSKPDPVSTKLELPENGKKNLPLGVKLQWQVVASASNYKLQLAQNENFESLITDKKIDGTSFQASDLSNSKAFYWRVKPLINDKKTKWSTVYSFTTADSENTGNPDPDNLSAPLQVSPKKGAENISLKPTFKWEAVDGADSYILHANSIDPTRMVIEVKVNSTSYAPKQDLDPQTDHDWRVRAVSNGNKGNWSSIQRFKTGVGDDNNSNASTGSVSSDRQALMDLYEATSGDNWDNNEGWGSGDPSDSWYGIETNAQGRVTRIDLFKNNLNGQLPETIGDLNKVVYFNVKNNYLTGKIPSSIGNMASLEWLILQGRTYEIGGTLKEPWESPNKHYHQGKHLSNTNDLSGTIPVSIGNLSNLERLEIANAPNIKGPIPKEIGKLSNLVGLYLSFNDFSGTTLPASIGNLTNLKHLYIASAQLEGEIPTSFKNLTKLTFLNLGESSNNTPDNHLTGPIPNFSQFTELRSIVLTDNELTGEYPHYWNNGNFEWLNTLRFTWNNLTGTLHGFENLPRIKSFGMEGNELTGGIDVLTTVPHNIRIIGVGWNNLSGDFPQKGWPDFSQIKTIRFNDNSFTDDIPCSFWDKLDNPKLNIAHFQDNQFNNTCKSSAKAMQGDGSVELGL